MASSSRLKALGEFSEIYSIGATKARILYDIHGLRDMDDLERYAGMYNHSTESQKETLKDSQANDKPNRKILRDMLSIRDDLSKKCVCDRFCSYPFIMIALEFHVQR